MWKDYHFLGDCKNSQSQHSDFCDFIIISKYYHWSIVIPEETLYKLKTNTEWLHGPQAPLYLKQTTVEIIA